MNHRFLLSAVAWFLAAAAAQGDDRNAIAALENAGATVERNESQKGKPVVRVTYNLRQVTDEGIEALKEIEELPSIEFLGTGDTQITVATLRALQGKKSLKRLAIAYAKISDESARILGTLKSLDVLELRVQLEMSPQGFNEIDNLTNLKELTISDRLVNDAVLDDLSKLPELKVLNVRSVFVTDDGLVSLRRLKNLRTLRIFIGSNVTIAGLRQLAELRLTTLEITFADIDVNKLKELRGLNSLKALRVINAKTCTDEAIPLLSELTELEELEVVGAKLTQSGLKQLKKALPKCKINTGSVN